MLGVATCVLTICDQISKDLQNLSNVKNVIYFSDFY